jgi:hypothetical protein
LAKYKTITPYVRERTDNFIKQLLNMIKFRLKEVKTIEIDGFKSKAIMYRPWFLHKIAEINVSSLKNVSTKNIA